MEEQRSFDEKREFWEKCLTFPDYEVSTNGRVRRSTQSKSMPGKIMQRHLNNQDRLWVMLRNEHSQQVRADIAELVAMAFLGHVPGKTAIIFVMRTSDPSANNLRVYGCEGADPKPVKWIGYEEANPLRDIAIALGADPQRVKDLQEDVERTEQNLREQISKLDTDWQEANQRGFFEESAAELEQRALFEQALIEGSDPQQLKDIMEGA